MDMSQLSSQSSSQEADSSTAVPGRRQSGVMILPVPDHSGWAELITHLLVRGGGESKLDEKVNGQTVLHFAVKRNDVYMARFLLDNGANPNIRDQDGYGPLHISSKRDRKEMVKLLLEKRAEPNFFSGSGDSSIIRPRVTPLHIAAQEGNMLAATELLKKGAGINIADSLEFLTPLLLAVEGGHYDMVCFLLANGANVDGDYRASRNPLLSAVLTRRMDLVQTLYCCGAELDRRDQDGDPAITNAAALGYMDIVKLILGISHNSVDLQGSSGRPAWWYAREYGHIEIMELLKKTQSDNQAEAMRDYAADIPDDSNSSFEDIGIPKILEEIPRAQKYVYPARDPDKWKEYIRFVVRAPQGESYNFEVIEPYRDGKDSQEPFVAVSYCWASMSKDTGEPLQIKVPAIDGTHTIIRPIRARQEVLHRSLEFAHSRGIRQVWIDQECIHQDDDEDKRRLVGSMHHLYRQATFTLAVLGRHIQSVEDIGVLGYLLRDSILEYSEDEREQVIILTNRIFQDRWFKRAWTTQEAISASTGNMVYIVGWDRNLDHAGFHWEKMAASLTEGSPRQTLRRELLIDGDTKHTMSSRVKGGYWTSSIVEMSVNPTESFTLSSGSLENYPWYRSNANRTSASGMFRAIAIPTASVANSLSTLLRLSSKKKHERRCDADYSRYKQSISQISRVGHHAMAMTSALTVLYGKRNLMTSDKLNIIANISRYHYFLDVRKLIKEEPNISYTACVIALGFANGDMSFLTDHQELRHWAGSQSSVLSWLPSHGSFYNLTAGSYSMPDHIFKSITTSTGSPCFVVNGMLLVRGVLWEIELYEGLLPLQKDIRKCLSSCRDDPQIKHHVGTEVLKAVIRQLFEKSSEQLVSLVMTLARGRVFSKTWESPTEFCSTLQQLRDWCYNKQDWPPLPLPPPEGSSERRSNNYDQKSTPKFKINPSNDFTTTENPTPLGRRVLNETIPSEWGDDLLRWIYLTISYGAPLPIGKFRTADDTYQYAMFILNPNDSKMAFVPLSELNYTFKSTFSMTIGDFWCVRRADVSTVSEEDKAQARANLDERNVEVRLRNCL